MDRVLRHRLCHTHHNAKDHRTALPTPKGSPTDALAPTTSVAYVGNPLREQFGPNDKPSLHWHLIPLPNRCDDPDCIAELDSKALEIQSA